MRLLCLLAARRLDRVHDEQGDVPGWVLVTGMTVALVMVIWSVASDVLGRLVSGFLSGVSFGN